MEQSFLYWVGFQSPLWGSFLKSWLWGTWLDTQVDLTVEWYLDNEGREIQQSFEDIDVDQLRASVIMWLCRINPIKELVWICLPVNEPVTWPRAHLRLASLLLIFISNDVPCLVKWKCTSEVLHWFVIFPIWNDSESTTTIMNRNISMMGGKVLSERHIHTALTSSLYNCSPTGSFKSPMDCAKFLKFILSYNAPTDLDTEQPSSFHHII